MDNGSGDTYTVLFTDAGACIQGFDHLSPMSPFLGDGTVWPGVVDAVPWAFRPFLDSSVREGILPVRACLWRESADDRWRVDDIEYDGHDDGANRLFRLLTDGTPEVFQRELERYYSTEVDLGAVRHVFASRPLTHEVVTALNPDITRERAATRSATRTHATWSPLAWAALHTLDLSPLERLTARYATGAARRAWHRALVSMTPEDALLAVHGDPCARPEHVRAALAVFPVPPPELAAATASLRARLP